MNEGISLREVLEVFRKYKVLILMTTIGAALLAGIISLFFIPPVYQSSTQILVNQNNSTMTQNIQNDLQLVETYSDIITSSGIVNRTREQLQLTGSIESLSEAINVTSNPNSQLITISVRDSDPERAVSIANALVSVFEAEAQELISVSNVAVISPAFLHNTPLSVAQSPWLNMLVGAVIGLLIGSSLAFLVNFTRTSARKK